METLNTLKHQLMEVVCSESGNNVCPLENKVYFQRKFYEKLKLGFASALCSHLLS